MLASLDHPNIGQIYGIEEAGQTKALVLQLIEGPTLADKIAQGPIPEEDALKIALQMAAGLGGSFTMIQLVAVESFGQRARGKILGVITLVA